MNHGYNTALQLFLFFKIFQKRSVVSLANIFLLFVRTLRSSKTPKLSPLSKLIKHVLVLKHSESEDHYSSVFEQKSFDKQAAEHIYEFIIIHVELSISAAIWTLLVHSSP